MPFDSHGAYTPATGATTAVAGALIKSATWNAIFTDLSSALTLLGEQLYNTNTVTFGASPYTPVATDTLLLLTTSGGAITINLPSAASRNGYPLRIKDNTGNAATNNITIARNGADTIEGRTSFIIANNWGLIELQPVTGGWIISASNSSNDLAFTQTCNGTANATAAAGQTVLGGSVPTMSLTANGTAALWNSSSAGAIIGGRGSSTDLVLANKNVGTVMSVPTGTQTANFPGSVLVTGATGIGYGTGTGAGGAVTQATSRTTGVTLNTPTGAITLVSAAGSASYNTFTVTNSTVAATDVVHACQKSGTDKYIVLVTTVAAGSFNISFATTGGTTTEQPVFNFAVIKGSAN
jgi:hypothetical protein